MLFQLRIARRELVDLATHLGIKRKVDHFRTKKLLKDVYSKLHQDIISEVKYFISTVVAFPVSEVIVKSLGTIIENVISNTIAFKEADSPGITDMTEISGSIARNCFKQNIILDGYDTNVDFVKHRKGFTSGVVRGIMAT